MKKLKDIVELASSKISTVKVLKSIKVIIDIILIFK
jgi:hypothetical protein